MAGPSKATNTRSTVRSRATAATPRKATEADSAIARNTTTAFRLPAPMRTSVLLPQPDAMTIPMPNKPPPTNADSHIQRVPA